MPNGRLYVVATPIGNLDDLTPRAKSVLAAADLILAEDTRQTAKLLAFAGIVRPMRALHEHNEKQEAERAVAELEAGKVLALVSDAGTPAISDPGALLVRQAREAGIAVESVAGPSALAAALAASGFAAEPAVFLGFPPPRSGARRKFLEPWGGIEAVLVIYEAPHRIAATLTDLVAVFGAERRAILLRELTKIHEEGIDGTLDSIRAEVARRGELRGEIVLVLDRPDPSSAAPIAPDSLTARYDELLAEVGDRREALKRLAKESGRPRAEIYRALTQGGRS